MLRRLLDPMTVHGPSGTRTHGRRPSRPTPTVFPIPSPRASVEDRPFRPLVVQTHRDTEEEMHRACQCPAWFVGNAESGQKQPKEHPFFPSGASPRKTVATAALTKMVSASRQRSVPGVEKPRFRRALAHFHHLGEVLTKVVRRPEHLPRRHPYRDERGPDGVDSRPWQRVPAGAGERLTPPSVPPAMPTDRSRGTFPATRSAAGRCVPGPARGSVAVDRGVR